MVVPLGGGGLGAGVALAIKTFKPEVRVIGAIPEGINNVLNVEGIEAEESAKDCTISQEQMQKLEDKIAADSSSIILKRETKAREPQQHHGMNHAYHERSQ